MKTNMLASAGKLVLGSVLVSFAAAAAEPRPKAPRIWNDKDLADWALPVAALNAKPSFYSEAEYYAAPVVEHRTYPVYHPDREPAGYCEWLQL
jgi:hypothetical protein